MPVALLCRQRLATSALAVGLLGCLAAGAPSGHDSYYEVLGLGREATTQDARRQFRKLSVKLHPDKNPSANTPQGRAAYERLQLANEWLANDDKRQLYDLYGEWKSSNDRARGHQFAGRHSAIEFFRDEPLIRNVRTESEAQQIFGLKTRRAYLMMLYAPWLSSCVEATDVYRKVASNLREETGEDGIQLAAVNCESNLQTFCLKYGRLRNQFELPVVLLLDPTESLTDRYRGRMVAEELAEYAIASDKGIRHVHTLDERSFSANIADAGTYSADFWLVLFCTNSEPLCRDVKPVLKRLAYSAKSAAKVGLVNCRQRRSADGYVEVEPFCQEQGAEEVPVLMAYRRGVRSEQKGEAIPLLPTEQDDPMVAAPMLVLRAMEAVLRLGAPVAPPAASADASGEAASEEPGGKEEEL